MRTKVQMAEIGIHLRTYKRKRASGKNTNFNVDGENEDVENNDFNNSEEKKNKMNFGCSWLNGTRSKSFIVVCIVLLGIYIRKVKR